MSPFIKEQGKLQKILKKIESGKAGEADIVRFLEIINGYPDSINEIMERLCTLMLKSDLQVCESAISVLDKMAQNYAGLEDFPVNVIIDCLQKRKNELPANSMLKLVEILSKVMQTNPDHLRTAVPALLLCLENGSAKVRELSYFILALLATTHHEFFRGCGKSIIRVLNGLNVDERIYACRLTEKLAEKDSEIVAETMDVLEDMRLNHIESRVRRAAGFAMDKLRKPEQQRVEYIEPVMQEPVFEKPDYDNVPEIFRPGLLDKGDMKEMLEGMGLGHMIVDCK